MAKFAATIVLSLLLECLAVWRPADSVHDLDKVEHALHTVENAKLSPELKNISTLVAKDVEKVVTQLKTDKKMTKAQRMEKVKGAIQKLQGLSAQWELMSVEGALHKITDLPSLSSAQRVFAKKVVADVEGTVHQVESGKLVGDARTKEVGLAIQKLEGLGHDWLNLTTATRVNKLEQELAAKKGLLKKEEAELKLAGLEKELLEKKMLLRKLTAQQEQAASEEKERKEDEAQQEMVSRLVATAKALATKGNRTGGTTKSATPSSAAVVPSAANSSISAILADLKAREGKIAAALDHMDADEKKREDEINKSIEEGQKAPAMGKTDAVKKGQSMLKMLAKQGRRQYLKARAARESERLELHEAISSIDKGDVAALSRVMAKMQAESQSLQGNSKKFLY